MKKINSTIMYSLLTCVVAGTLLLVNAQTRQRQEFDPLMPLKQALKEANAPDLSSAQEEQLKTLVQNFREAHKPEPNEAARDAHRAYDDAILAGDTGAAQAAAQAIVNATTAEAAAHLRDAAALKIQVIAVLKANPGQFNALTQRFGTQGLLGVLNGLVGGGPMRGPGGPGGPGGLMCSPGGVPGQGPEGSLPRQKQ
ncbi:MAG TPA: hypothetical protein VEF04_05600 [Blastocatellia bacterium]|nr:hypothetical protein [Blastocatellia bacterium]